MEMPTTERIFRHGPTHRNRTSVPTPARRRSSPEPRITQVGQRGDPTRSSLLALGIPEPPLIVRHFGGIFNRLHLKVLRK